MPPMMGDVAPATGMDQNAQGNGSQDSARQGLEQVMGQIRDLGQSLQAIGSAVPAFGPEVQQIQQILKRMVVKAAQQAPKQTASTQAIPGG